MNIPAQLALAAYDAPGDWLVEARHDTLYIAIDGTNCPRDWRRDLEFIFTADDVHAGFANYSTRLQAEMWAAGVDVMEHRNLLITGHSLGGAVATLIAAELSKHRRNISLVTFGSPRPGGARFARRFSVPHARYVHGMDAIPHCPPALFGFRHTVPPRALPQPSDSLLRSISDHDMAAYASLVK